MFIVVLFYLLIFFFYFSVASILFLTQNQFTKINLAQVSLNPNTSLNCLVRLLGPLVYFKRAFNRVKVHPAAAQCVNGADGVSAFRNCLSFVHSCTDEWETDGREAAAAAIPCVAPNKPTHTHTHKKDSQRLCAYAARSKWRLVVDAQSSTECCDVRIASV